MSQITTLTELVPSATPSEDEIAQWNALPRDEQVRRMRLALSHPDCDRIGTSSMEDIRRRGQALADALRRG